MTLIDGDKIITAEFYDDEHKEFIEKKKAATSAEYTTTGYICW